MLKTGTDTSPSRSSRTATPAPTSTSTCRGAGPVRQTPISASPVARHPDPHRGPDPLAVVLLARRRRRAHRRPRAVPARPPVGSPARCRGYPRVCERQPAQALLRDRHRAPAGAPSTATASAAPTRGASGRPSAPPTRRSPTSPTSTTATRRSASTPRGRRSSTQALATAPDADRLGARRRPDRHDQQRDPVDQLVQGHGGRPRPPRTSWPLPATTSTPGDKLHDGVEGALRVPAQQPDDSRRSATWPSWPRATPTSRAQYRALFDHWSRLRGRDGLLHRLPGHAVHHRQRHPRHDVPDAGRPARRARRPSCPSTKSASCGPSTRRHGSTTCCRTARSKWNVVTFHQPVYSTSRGPQRAGAARVLGAGLPEARHRPGADGPRPHLRPRLQEHRRDRPTPGITDGPVYIVSNSGAKHYELETDERNVWTQQRRHPGAARRQASRPTRSSTSPRTRSSTRRTWPRRPPPPRPTSRSATSTTGSRSRRPTTAASGSPRPVSTRRSLPPPPSPRPSPTPHPTVAPTPAPTSSPATSQAPAPSPGMVQTDVRPRASNLRVGKRAVLRLDATAAGTVRITAKRGKVTVVRVVEVDGDTRRSLRLPRKLTKRAGRLVVRVVLTPTASTDLPSRTTLHTAVRR